MKKFVKKVGPYQTLYIDTKTGIALIEDGTTGTAHSCHPNIDITGSVRGMKKLGYWGKKDRTVRCCGTIFNIDKVVVVDELDEIAKKYCRCRGNH